MIFFITGGSASGKSEYAERLALRLSNKEQTIPLLYLATMKRGGKEAEERIRRHQKQREGRGFYLFEAPALEDLKKVPKAGTILFDCLSNFTANILFSGSVLYGIPSFFSAEEISQKMTEYAVTEQIFLLRERCDHLIIVSDAVFSDGMNYDPGTEAYIRVLGNICTRLAERASCVAEVVFGLPYIIREAKEGQKEVIS